MPTLLDKILPPGAKGAQGANSANGANGTKGVKGSKSLQSHNVLDILVIKKVAFEEFGPSEMNEHFLNTVM